VSIAKRIIALILIALALLCMGSTVWEYLAAKGARSIWSADVMGAAAFHGSAMIAAAFLLSGGKARSSGSDKEGA
jgi:hypothetical protein